MIDSCSPRKLEPGLAERYSKSRDLTTSTMKSEPGRFVVSTSGLEDCGSTSFGSTGATADFGGAGCLDKAPELATRVPAVPEAAGFKNGRRATFSSIKNLHPNEYSASILRRALFIPDLSAWPPSRQMQSAKAVLEYLLFARRILYRAAGYASPVEGAKKLISTPTALPGCLPIRATGRQLLGQE